MRHAGGEMDSLMAMFVHEVRVMIRAGQHLNLVNVLGFTLDENPTLLVELCDMGSLLANLQQCQRDPTKFVNLLDSGEDCSTRTDGSEKIHYDQAPSGGKVLGDDERDKSCSLSTSDLVSFAYQVSRGMEHLSAKNIVHRDIASRNILLTKKKVAKISDFGMARWSETAYMMTSATAVNLPIRWMSPETIASMIFDQKSDVWSYGVLLWEMFSLGQIPYPNVAVAGRVEQFGQWLLAGNRLDRPQFCPDNVFAEMGKCWNRNAADRPSFADLSVNFEGIISTDVAGYYMHLNEPYAQFTKELFKPETYVYL
ncbi:hypothetical protein RvY_18526-2 [Ramazzottius varieornatus]|uniref:Protein kinase domain-containing protein n=1 Tax=Ramazzottius varieornatus TaxID=947166 RepID=A0A1D1W638_RAMVA|nr:hypothetical protein RvY_18526-2 [Ramazzottius varieornatus]